MQAKIEAILKQFIEQRQLVQLMDGNKPIVVLPRALTHLHNNTYVVFQHVDDKGSYVLLDRWGKQRIFFGFAVKPRDEDPISNPLAPMPSDLRMNIGEVIVEST